MNRPTTVRWRILGLLLLTAALCHFNRISISVAGNERLMKDYSIPPEKMGPVYSAYLLVYTILMTPGGWFIDRFGSKRALLVVGFGSAIFMALTGLTGALIVSSTALLTSLMIVRGFMGAANAPIHPAAAKAVSWWFPTPRLALANGLINAAAIVGIASTYLLFGPLMDKVGLPGAFMISGGITAVAAVCWMAYSADRPHQHPHANMDELKLIEGGRPPEPAHAERGSIPRERRKSLALLTLSYAAIGYFEYLFFYWMPYYFEQVVKADKVEGRLYSMITTLAMGLGSIAGGWLTDRAQTRWGVRRGRAAVPVAGMLAGAVFLGIGILSRQPLVVVVFFSLALASIGACEGAFWTTAVELGGPRGGVAAAIVNTGGNAGGVLSPVTTPLFSKFFGWQSGLALACVFSILGAVLWKWIDAGGSGARADAPEPAPKVQPSFEEAGRST